MRILFVLVGAVFLVSGQNVNFGEESAPVSDEFDTQTSTEKVKLKIK